MPYLKEYKREAIKKSVRKSATEIGDVNYVYTLYIIERWTAEPHYTTIAYLKKVLYGGYRPSDIQKLDREIAYRGWDVLEIQSAKQAAYDEFYLRVGRNYEMEKAYENGDVYANVPYAVTIGQGVVNQKPKRTRRSPLSGGRGGGGE